MARIPAVSRPEFENLIASVAALERQVAADHGMRSETHAMMADLHRRLLEPEPGHDHNLLDRMAQVAIGVESAHVVGRVLIWIAGLCAALAALVKLGQWPTAKGG